LKELDF